MDITTISQLIGSLGFPIAACIAMFIMMNKTNESHKEETDKLREAIENNTIIITKLYEKMGSDK